MAINAKYMHVCKNNLENLICWKILQTLNEKQNKTKKKTNKTITNKS